jgi:hypothetical protein
MHMELVLMGLCLSLLGVTVCAMAFGAATRGEPPAEAPQPAAHVALPSPRFFIHPAPSDTAAPRVPIEVLLLQLERHVRLEQAAAESFLSAPTLESLHTRTTSPLVH